MRFRVVFVSSLCASLLGAAAAAQAQPIGTFTWQLKPYCNVVTLHVTGVAGVYTLEGFDDQCGASTRAPLTGVGTQNPDGSIGFGLHVVTTPGGRGLQIDARLSIQNLSGSWSDSAGHAGTFAFNARSGGNPRPAPAIAPVIPPAIALRADGGLLATGTPGSGAIPASGPGTRMMWHAGKAAFRAGAASTTEWDDPNVGVFSAAFGANVKATAHAAFAAGYLSSATGIASTVFGYSSRADGSGSVAAGAGAIAAGPNSVAIGGEFTPQGGVNGVFASGAGAIAVGIGHDAAGAGSVALGTRVTTTVAAAGSFVYGDRSAASQVQSFTANEFLVRAAGGTTFYSNAGMTAGVKLASGAGAWSALSDVNSKENFRDLDGGDVLARIARLPIREWNYKAQDAAIRHVGPTAQDFHAAFGLGEDPLRISTIDADGIALAAVKALALENETLKAALAALSARMERLEAQR